MSEYKSLAKQWREKRNEINARCALEEKQRQSARDAETARRLLAERRERIATAALQGMMANSSRLGPPWEAVKIAIEFADELMAELDKEPQP